MVLEALVIKLADRIWISCAYLHCEMPERGDFAKYEIRQKMREIGMFDGLKPSSVAAHLKEHLVANVPPSSTKYLMLYETRPGFLRLYRPGDRIDPRRQSNRPTKQAPRRAEIPARYHFLLDWYDTWSVENRTSEAPINWEDDPLIRLIGSGKHIWADEHADEYVERLREEPA